MNIGVSVIHFRILLFLPLATVISKQSLDGESDAENGSESVSVIKRGMAFGVIKDLLLSPDFSFAIRA